MKSSLVRIWEPQQVQDAFPAYPLGIRTFKCLCLSFGFQQWNGAPEWRNGSEISRKEQETAYEEQSHIRPQYVIPLVIYSLYDTKL
jgi:hypothetical protein